MPKILTDMETPCKYCYLRYSSYCIGCQYVKDGLGLSHKEYEEYLKRRKEQNNA